MVQDVPWARRNRALATKQLQRTVARRRGRGASASFHYALAPRWPDQHAAAELRRSVAEPIPQFAMALFVHLAPEKETNSIRRGGIKPRRLKEPLADGYDRIVFAMPVTDDFYVSHQWLRELKRSGQRTIVGVYFRIPDEQPVMVGHYNQNHQVLSATEAVGIVFNAEQPEGFEVIIPRKIKPTEIQKINSVPQVMGWRYYPDAKGKKPCGCLYCTKGDINSRRIREAYEKSFGG